MEDKNLRLLGAIKGMSQGLNRNTTLDRGKGLSANQKWRARELGRSTDRN